VSRPFPSWNRPILTEIYLCHACSYHEIEDGNGPDRFPKHLYGLAAEVAEQAAAPGRGGPDPALLADVFRRHADHLYSKGDLEGAMEQYRPRHIIILTGVLNRLRFTYVFGNRSA
jgi:hypothetical protein